MQLTMSTLKTLMGPLWCCASNSSNLLMSIINQAARKACP